jgi:hypothetical protein
MHPYILQSLAAERARDMHKRAAESRLSRLARHSRRAARVRTQPLHPGTQPALESLTEQDSREPAVLARKA